MGHRCNRSDGAVGNLLFIIVGPKTEVLVGAGRFADMGVEVTIATVFGAVLIISGAFMVLARYRQVPPSADQDVARIMEP